MVWIAVMGAVAVSLVLFVRKALRDYGDAAAAVDERLRENDADNAMFGKPIRRDDTAAHVGTAGTTSRETSAAN